MMPLCPQATTLLRLRGRFACHASLSDCFSTIFLILAYASADASAGARLALICVKLGRGGLAFVVLAIWCRHQ
jgi:hypothetical protein